MPPTHSAPPPYAHAEAHFQAAVLAQVVLADLAATVGAAGVAGVAAVAVDASAGSSSRGPRRGRRCSACRSTCAHTPCSPPAAPASPGSESLAAPGAEAQEAAGGLQGPVASTSRAAAPSVAAPSLPGPQAGPRTRSPLPPPPPTLGAGLVLQPLFSGIVFIISLLSSVSVSRRLPASAAHTLSGKFGFGMAD